MSVQIHEAAEGTLIPRDGWYFARCTCGLSFGPLPDTQSVLDVLMEHAFDEKDLRGGLRGTD